MLRLAKVERPSEVWHQVWHRQPVPTVDCLGMSLKLNLLPIARQDVVIGRCKRKTTDPTDHIRL